LLFAPGNIETLRSLLHRLASEPELRQRLGAAARLRAVESFSLEAMIQQYRHLYCELAKQRGIWSDN